MPTPTTAEQFLDLVQRSDLIAPDRWAEFLGRLTRTELLTRTPIDLAQQLIREGHLTEFQTEQLLQGKFRGFNVGKYKVLERLGVGAMGTVYLCEHPGMRRRVAVKVLPASMASNPNVLARFQREAKAMAAIDHVNLVQAHDIDQDGQMHFLVMDYVDGVNLNQLVLKVGPLTPLRAAHYIRQAALGLQHAHEAGLVHRDIKPGNLLVDRNGTVRVLDLGLARFFHDDEDLLTLQYDDKVMLGTVDYVAPEQVRDSHSVDIRADIYSLGATFYYLLAGHPLFPEGTKLQKLAWQQHHLPQPIHQLRSDVPSSLSTVLMRMLAKNPADRYQTPAEVVAALTPFTQTPIAPPTEQELPQRSLAARGTPGGRSGSDQGTEKPAAPTPAAVPGPRPTAPVPSPVPHPAAVPLASSVPLGGASPHDSPGKLSRNGLEPPEPSKPRWTVQGGGTPRTTRSAASAPKPQLPSPRRGGNHPAGVRATPLSPPPLPAEGGGRGMRMVFTFVIVLIIATVLGISAGWVLNASTPTPTATSK
jgi:serine/threonine protein kinase